jgi:osmotically-inducible protein OsmY
VAHAIFGESPLDRYATGTLPAIHIIVENGHVTLSGIVAGDGDKNLAGIRARGAGLSFGSVVNNLEVEHPSKKS